MSKVAGSYKETSAERGININRIKAYVIGIFKSLQFEINL